MSTVRVSMVNQVVPDWAVQDAFTGITAAVGLRKGYRVDRPDPSTLVIVHRYTPTWAAVVGVLLIWVFLLGLIFFAVKTEERLTVIGHEDGAGGRYTITGQTDGALAAVLKEQFDPEGKHRWHSTGSNEL